jgi:hypothetical protein
VRDEKMKQIQKKIKEKFNKNFNFVKARMEVKQDAFSTGITF